MYNLKKNLKISFLFVLLLAIILLPGFFMAYRNSNILDEVSLYSVGMLQIESDSSKTAAEKLDIWERIALINGAVIEVQSTEYTDLRLKDGLLLEMEAQLKQIQSFKALPEFSLEGEASAIFAYKIYMSSANPELSVSVWQICAEYEDYTVYAYMDVELLAIYDIMITDHKGASLVYASNMSPIGFLKYLNTFTANIALEESFSVNHYYGAEAAHLSLISMNIPNGKTVFYHITDFDS